MKKGDVIQGRIEQLNFPNKGVMRTPEGSCVVKNTLPGQLVSVRVTKRRQGRAEGRLLEVLEPAPDEIVPPCAQFGICGGCAYLNLPYEKTLELKEIQVRRLLEQALVNAQGVGQEVGQESGEENVQKPGQEDGKEFGQEEQERKGESAGEAEGGREICEREALPWFEGIKASPRNFGYRNKMEFTFGDAYKDGPLELGMHKRGSFYDIVTVSECQIVDEDYRAILCAVREHFASQEPPVPFYHRLSHQGYLRHLLVRKASLTGEILIDLVTTSQQEHDLRPLTEKLLALPLTGTIAGILHTTNDAVADVIRDEGTEILFGRDYFYEKLLGLSFKITPFSFFQTNSYGAEVLYDTAREFLRDVMEKRKENAEGEEAEADSRPLVFDLYSGTGTIAQLMAPAARRVIGVEIVEEAVEAARENAARNGLTNCEFIAGDVLKVLDEIQEKPDVIILDPPRDGVHPKALPKILAYGVENILYISCKPTSLARDLPAFYAAGYRVRRGVCVDQFPWTTGVETIILLTRQ